MLRQVSSFLEGCVVTNSENRIVLKVEEVGDFGIHLTDLEKHDFKLNKKNQTGLLAKGLCFFYQDSYDGLAGYVYPSKLEVLNGST
jgi:hypothetical protein